MLYADGTSFKSAKPPNGVPWEPVHRTGSLFPFALFREGEKCL
ncbi:hypothetical protein FDUTEX481_07630 [Tolypothrix sp. PCC 7601]|nr:hypothetical protein FDUTEX481_07630 [Tolypothrix sp. PCC 7601]